MSLLDIIRDSFVALPARFTVKQAREFLRGLEPTHIIVVRPYDTETFYYLFTVEEFFGRLGRPVDEDRLESILDLHESDRTGVVDVSIDPLTAPEWAVVLREGRIVGFLDATTRRIWEREALLGPDQPDVPRESFSAYPRLDAPERVQPEERFEVTVGYHAEADPSLRDVKPIYIENPPPDARLLVMLFVDGATVLDGHHRDLPLEMEATVTFACQAKRDVAEVTVSVDYIYGSQVVGAATRIVQVAPAGAAVSPALAAEPRDRCRLGTITPEHAVDLTVTITKTTDGQLQWTFVAPKPLVKLGPLTTQLTGAREFAGGLIKALQPLDYKGAFAERALLNVGQSIAGAMPPEFFRVLADVYRAVDRKPVLLLRTEETYVPWELAVLDDPLDPDVHPFLFTQTYMGRWLRHDKVVDPPPTVVGVERFTIVASEYGLESGRTPLREALREQENLEKYREPFDISVIPLEATIGDMETAVSVKPKPPGHLIHLAVHGQSDPQANEQSLLLADKTRLPSSALAGRHRCGEVPTFSFVFLNACQVGIPGTCLGQAAGFPGDLIRGGAFGFVAPLWKVHDEPARKLAEAFYKASLDRGETIAKSLHEQRVNYDPQGTTTPIAYIFYGHPNLRLKAKRR